MSLGILDRSIHAVALANFIKKKVKGDRLKFQEKM